MPTHTDCWWRPDPVRAALRLAGSLPTLWHLTRPRLAAYVLGIVLFGYGFAHFDADRSHAHNLSGLGWLLVSWWLLNAGTMWLNAALDREEGEAVFSRGSYESTLARWELPFPLHYAGFGALTLAVLVALATPPVAAGCAAVCAVLAVLYSHPRTAWKGRPVAGPLVNGLGYGLLSPLAGWAVADAPFTARALVTLGLWTLWMLGAYFCAQAFQREDDERRGYRTLVVTHGPASALRVARWCMNLAVVAAFALSAWGFYPRMTLLGYPGLVAADTWMKRWQVQPGGGHAGWAAGLFRRMVGAGGDIIALAYLDYLVS